jgi:hypothetical protein
VGFVIEKVALGKVFLLVLLFPLSISFHHGSPLSYIIREIENTVDPRNWKRLKEEEEDRE